MPRGDGTGPAGTGGKTGRGAGYCAGTGAPGFANRPGGRGVGAGFGGGRGRGIWCSGFGRWSRNGFGGWFNPNRGTALEVDRQELEAHASALQAELDRVKKRLEEIQAPRQEK